jgi:hypothetical protein
MLAGVRIKAGVTPDGITAIAVRKKIENQSELAYY